MLERYAYTLPEELIARAPAEPRDSSRLFVFNTKTGEICLDVFSNLPAHILENSLMVFNNTKVVPARVELFKETGGKVELLFLVNEWKGSGAVPVISDRKLVVGQKISRGDYFFTVSLQQENIFMLRPEFPEEELRTFLHLYGTTPVPKYIGSHLPEKDLREKYQTIFSEIPASVAAPTASLHFTQAIFEELKARNVQRTFISLHVGLGTFAPLREENLRGNKLHTESYDISYDSAEHIATSRREGNKIIAVGTTTLRALESAADDILNSREVIGGKTNIFIHPPFDFKITDALITNFHVPKSSLMLLVDAFLQHKKSPKDIIELYKIAIENKFRFYSFGDAMLIL